MSRWSWSRSEQLLHLHRSRHRTLVDTRRGSLQVCSRRLRLLHSGEGELCIRSQQNGVRCGCQRADRWSGVSIWKGDSAARAAACRLRCRCGVDDDSLPSGGAIRRSPRSTRVAGVHFFIGDSFPKYMDLPGVGSQVISAGSPRESSFMSLAKLARLGPDAVTRASASTAALVW